MKKLYVKVHAFELLGGLKSDEPAPEAAPAEEPAPEAAAEVVQVFDDGALVEVMEDGVRIFEGSAVTSNGKSRKRA